MAVEENIPTAEELAAIDPFATPVVSAESVFGFPEIQKEADNTSLFEHTDHGTTNAVLDMHADLEKHDTYKFDLDNKEEASISEKDDIWEKRLERMAGRKVDHNLDKADSHDFILEEESKLEADDPIQPVEDINIEDVDTSVLDELENIQHQLEHIGGVSRNEIAALESLLESPGAFGNLRGYSIVHSRSGYQTTMEALGEKIKTLVADIIKRLIQGCKDLMSYVMKWLGADFMGQHMTVSLITRRQELLTKARRIDAVYGLQSFKGLSSATNIPPYKEATSTENYAIRYLDYRTKVRFQSRFTNGMRMIVENSGLSGHVKNLRGEIDRTLQQVETYISILAKTEANNWGKVDTQMSMSGLNQLLAFWNIKGQYTPSEALSEYRAAINFAFRQEDTGARRPWEFVKVANYTNPFSDNPNFHRTVGASTDRIIRSLKDLERKVSGLPDTSQQTVATGKLQEVQRRLNVVQSMFSSYLGFAKYYESFYQVLAQPIIILSRQMAVFTKKQAFTNAMSSEGLSVSSESFLGGPAYFDGLMRAQGWKPDSEKAEDVKVDNRALVCAKQINEGGFEDLREIFHQCLKDRWLFPGKYDNSNQGHIDYLHNAGLIYRPKVVDLEEETPDWGITDFGREVGEILYGVIDDTKPDPKIQEVLDCIWDDERLGARELLRHHGREGFQRFDDSQIKQITEDVEAIRFLETHGLVKANKPYHPLHDADEGTWVVTSLGMEVAKRF